MPHPKAETSASTGGAGVVDCCGYSPTCPRLVHGASGKRHGQYYLDRRVESEALASDRVPRPLSTIAVEFHEEVGCAVYHSRLVVESGRGVDVPRHAHHLIHPVEVPESVLERGQAGKRGVAGGFVALLDRQVRSDHPGHVYAVLEGHRPGEIEEVADRKV